MIRNLVAALVSTAAVVALVAPAAAQGPEPRQWVAVYCFVAPPSLLGDTAKAGLAAFTLTNHTGRDVKDVVVAVEPAANAGFGPFNTEQAGSVSAGSSAVLHVQLLLSASAASFPVTVTWKEADGSRHGARIDAFDIAEIER
jgi:hypothetical protein